MKSRPLRVLVACWVAFAVSPWVHPSARAQEAAPSGEEAAAHARVLRLLASGAAAQAARESELALSGHARSYRLLTAFVDAHRALASSREAAARLQARIEADPENPYLHYALGLALQHVQDDAPALRAFRRAAELAPEFALTYRELAYTHRRLGSLEEAAALFEAEVAAGPERANPHYALGFVHNYRGDVARALDHLDRAIALDPDLLDAYRYAARLRLDRGDFADSLRLSQELRRRAEALSDPLYRAFALNGVGAASLRLAQYAQAIASYREALAVQRELGDRQGEWSTQNGLGVIYANLGDPDKALACYQEALRVLGPRANPRWKATSLHNIGVTHSLQGRPVAARPYLREALKLREGLGDRREQAYSLTEIGLTYARQGRTAEGSRYLDQAARAAADSGDRFLQAAIQTTLGEMHERGGAYPQAGEYYGKALAMAERIRHPEMTWRARRGLGAAAAQEGKLEEARAHYARAIEGIEGIRQQVHEDQARTLFLQGKMAAYEGMVGLLHRLHLRSPAEGYDRQALAYAQRAKARAFLDLLAEARAEVRKGMTPGQFEEERRILRERSAVQRQLLQDAGAEAQRSALLTRLTAVEDQLETFRSDLRRTNPAYAALQYPEPEPLEKLQAALLDGESRLIEYMVGEEQSFAWLVSRDAVQMIVLPGRRALEGRVSPYLALIGKPPTSVEATERAARGGRELFRLLMGPFGGELRKASRLLIVPDGVLHYLPFESLVASFNARGQPRYLLESHDVAYTPAASVLAELERRPRPAAPLELLAYGAPPLQPRRARPTSTAGTRSSEVMRGLLPSRGYGDLPYARREVRAIARLFPEDRQKVCLGEGASESALKKEDLSRYRILHFATHGVLDDRAPGRSGLLLAPGHPDEDGLLQGVEILNLEVEADLVVLSACGSGLGRLVRGEGLVGLSRAFFYAGARTLVVSLWNVNDESTSELMRAFYSHLAQGLGRAHALRKAKRAMLLSDRPAHRFPYYWAPFILVGRSE